MPIERDYETISRRMAASPANPDAAMQRVVDTLWEGLQATGVSWVGFYLLDGGQQLVLGPRRDKPACSPIGLHGACGRALRSRRAFVVRDVSELGKNYVACDPRDRSEIVIPLVASDGACHGVLDLDSHEIGSFDETDVTGLTAVLRAAGLTS